MRKRVEDDLILPRATIKEVKQIIKKMKPSNSRGDSEVTGKIIKILSGYMSVAMTHLANKVFEKGKFPDAFKLARVIPLKKRGKPGDSFEGMQKRAKEKGFTFPYLFDEKQEVYPQYGATKTPHVYILNKRNDKLIVEYIGAIDDSSQVWSPVCKSKLATI